MKKLGILFLGLMFAGVAFGQHNHEHKKEVPPVKPGEPTFAEFDKVVHDFGQITPNEDAFVDFAFKNISGKSLLLNPPKTSCGCTTPSYPKEPIAVGGEETMQVKYSTKNRIGKFNKQIKVYAQGYDAPILLTIKGEVLPPEVVETTPTKKKNSLFKKN
ncbi:MAG: DUF1573 domain-containing protein [Saprospiraceae bacterium]|nr:DUF1573 domain-containing protein [Saprospiraceae bacterium]